MLKELGIFNAHLLGKVYEIYKKNNLLPLKLNFFTDDIIVLNKIESYVEIPEVHLLIICRCKISYMMSPFVEKMVS